MLITSSAYVSPRSGVYSVMPSFLQKALKRRATDSRLVKLQIVFYLIHRENDKIKSGRHDLISETARCHSFIHVKKSKLHIDKAMMKIIIARKRINVKLVKRLIVNSSKHGFRVDGFLVKLST